MPASLNAAEGGKQGEKSAFDDEGNADAGDVDDNAVPNNMVGYS